MRFGRHVFDRATIADHCMGPSGGRVSSGAKNCNGMHMRGRRNRTRTRAAVGADEACGRWVRVLSDRIAASRKFQIRRANPPLRSIALGLSAHERAQTNLLFVREEASEDAFRAVKKTAVELGAQGRAARAQQRPLLGRARG